MAITERAEARDPNTPWRRLKVLAKTYPREVLGNFALPLLWLEDPALAQKIERVAWMALLAVPEKEIFNLLNGLSHRVRVAFALACAGKVLHLFEAAHPDDDRPRRALEVARRYVNGGAVSYEEAKEVEGGAVHARGWYDDPASWRVCDAAAMTAYAVSHDYEAAEYAPRLAAQHAAEAMGNSEGPTYSLANWQARLRETEAQVELARAAAGVG